MTRRSTPERIDEAHRYATRRRLTMEGVSDALAASWIVAWELQATQDGLERNGAYWDAAWEWISAERQKRTRPIDV